MKSKYKNILILIAPIWLPCVYLVFSYFAQTYSLGYSTMGTFLMALMWVFKAIQIALYLMAVKILYDKEKENEQSYNAITTISIYTVLSLISIVFFALIVGFLWLESLWLFVIYFHWG